MSVKQEGMVWTKCDRVVHSHRSRLKNNNAAGSDGDRASFPGKQASPGVHTVC